MIGVVAFSVHILKLQLVLCLRVGVQVDEIVHCFKNVSCGKDVLWEVHRQLVEQVITSTANR